MTEPGDALVAYRLERSREALEEAQLLAGHGHANAAVNRLYYACFYAVSALLYSHGLSSAKHSGVRSLFGYHFVKTGLVSKMMGAFYNDLYENRQESDYEDFYLVDRQILPGWLEQAEEFVDIVTKLVPGNSADPSESS